MKKEVIILIIIMLSIPLVFAIPLINFNSPTPDKYSSFADTSWWNESWEYRQQINITNNDVTLVLTTNYTFTMNLNTSGGNFLFTGNDTRIIFYNGTDYNEIDRINTSSFNDTNTSLMFRIQENIPASSSDSNYYIYYGYSNADSPPENNSNVYLFFDDYNRANNVDITSESTYSEAGGSEWEIVNNQLKGSGGSGDPNKLMVDLFPNLDNVELQIKINVTTFAGGDSSRPGLSTRMDAGGQGYCANLHNAIGTLQFLDDARDWGSSTSVGWVLNEEYWLKFWNYEDDLKAKIWTTNTVEGSSWNLTQNSFAGHANGKVGIAMSNNADVIYYDDFSVRILVSTEPSYSFLGEESVDNLYPTFSNYWDDNATLNNSGVGGFNVTLTNTNGTVIFEINNTNITAINLSAD
ncbi:MAG: hypothetical protein KKF56_04805, partial [Nanoarchaeota archaeon]|nr:hypothetical protein [Nanoarchaeota archaeon]